MGRPASHIKRPARAVAPPVLGSIPSAHEALRARIMRVTNRGRFTVPQIAGALGISVGDQDAYLSLAYAVTALTQAYRVANVRRETPRVA